LERGRDKKEVDMPKSPSASEQDTFITFRKAQDIATVFTYERTLQKHLE
jgi:hypothetical protein